MNPRLVYIAGPYAAATPAEIGANVRRALALGALAVTRGFAPIVPHAQGWLSVYGTADESGAGVRDRALRCSRALARAVGEQGGDLWVIEREDRTLSTGTETELTAFVLGRMDFGGSRASALHRVTTRPWSGWLLEVGDLAEQVRS